MSEFLSQKENQYEFSNLLYYDTGTSKFSLTEMSSQLFAINRLSSRLPIILNEILKPHGITVELVDTKMGEITHGSVIEEFIPVLGFIGVTSTILPIVNEFITSKFIEKIYMTLVAVLAYAGNKEKSSEEKIKYENNIIYQNCTFNGSFPLLNTPQTKKAVKKGVNYKKENGIPDALDVVRPAKKRDSSIKFGGKDSEMIIPKETMKDYPTEYEKKKPLTEKKDFKHVKMIFRAADFDSLKKGWAGEFPDVTGNTRIPVTLPEGFLPTLLRGSRFIYVDISLIFKLSKKNVYIPDSAIIKKVFCNNTLVGKRNKMGRGKESQSTDELGLYNNK